VVYGRLYGCCDGKEYQWSAGCFGWFTAYHTNVDKCFDSPLESNGGCKEGNSIPIGGQIPGGHLDQGDVGIHPDDSTRG
jgi:hypothetical protein